MSFIDNYRRQHDELLEIATQISQFLSTESLVDNSQDVVNLLTKLTGKLLAHLAMEDKVLYPLLLKNKNEDVRETAQSFFSEMGDLQEVYKAYIDKWSDSRSIKQAAEDFVTETNTIFAALSKRIDRENNELYPLTQKI